MVSLILSETQRSYYYLKYLKKKKIKISRIIYFSNKKGKTFRYLEKNKMILNTLHLKTNNINSMIISKNINFLKNKIIYSGYPAQIIKNKKVLKKKLIHCHPGDLPNFKGSTTIFYTILLKKKITVTCFIINEKIDEGKILFKKKFKAPKKINHIQSVYDDKIRASTLVDYLKKGQREYKKKKMKKNNMYFIIHPILRRIVIKKNSIKLINDKH